MNGLPSVFSLILYLFQFALATFNPGAILLYLSFEKPIYMTLWYSCVCFAYGVSAPYFSYGFHVLPCVSPGGIQFITTNMIIEFFSLFSLSFSLYPVVLMQVLFSVVWSSRRMTMDLGWRSVETIQCSYSLSKKARHF